MNAKLKLEADQTIASWGVPGLSYRIAGKFAYVIHNGNETKCMKFNLIQLLNSVAVELA
jgi:hypothetical protein